MILYIPFSILSGILLAVMDGLINANPLAQRLYEVYQPIARPSINRLAGVLIDILWGFILLLMYLYFYTILPGATGPVKG